MSRHVLFYSDYCGYSKDVICSITKKNIAPLFLMVCVDTYRDMLPQFVVSVPTVLTHDRRVLVGASVFELVERLQAPPSSATMRGGSSGSSGSSGAMVAEPPADHSVHDVSGGSWSEGFSFLEPSQHSNGTGAFAGISDDMKIDLVLESTTSKSSSEDDPHKVPSTAYDRLMAQRNNDDAVNSTRPRLA